LRTAEDRLHFGVWLAPCKRFWHYTYIPASLSFWLSGVTLGVLSLSQRVGKKSIMP
jgi:hypothetical protein